jgi:hypothetical protein
MNARSVMAGSAAVLLLACSSSAGTQSGGQGGGGGTSTTASGGTTTSGGTTGTTASGGTTTSGGITGTTASGGTTTSGGTTGTTASGGTTTSGGTTGTTASGGTTTSGGTTGTTASGGTTTSDGAIASGGATASGGTTARGGSSGTGGTSAQGGATGAGGATSTSGCTREMLQAAVDAYLAAMKTGDPSSLPLTASATYTENGTKSQFGQGLWATPLAPDLTMSLLDVEKCGSYTELIAASASHPYVLGFRLAVTNAQISAVTVIVTDCDDWGFNAATYLKEAKAEQNNAAAGSGWGPVDPADRYTREELLAGGKAYFAYWGDKTVAVPWGYPCCRLEGGMVTNPDPNPNQNSTCSVGVPDQSFAPTVSDQLADVNYGMVVDFLGLPGPDSHWFRFTKSTDMRYIHTLTVCYVNGAWQCPGTQPTCN